MFRERIEDKRFPLHMKEMALIAILTALTSCGDASRERQYTPIADKIAYQRDTQSSEKIGYETYKLIAQEINYTGNIMISLAHPFEFDNDDYELLFAVTHDVEQLGVCLAGVPCVRGSKEYYEARIIYATEKKRFFRTKASALLEDKLIIRVVAHNEAGEEFDSRNIEFVYQGSKIPDPVGAPPPGTNTDKSSGGVTADDVRGIVQTNCGGGSCHPSFANNPDVLKNNGAAGRVQSGNMPLGRTMPAADKQKLLDFLGG